MHGRKVLVQALDRTQPSLPMVKGHATMTHDYKRHGTATLFAELDVLTGGKVIGSCLPEHQPHRVLEVPQGHRHRSPRRSGRASDPGHLRHPQTLETSKLWLGKHPRFHLHFTPPRRRG